MKTLVKKAFRRIGRVIPDVYLKFRCSIYDSRTKNMNVNCQVAGTYIDVDKIDVSGIDVKSAEYLSSMYLKHYFDLLGSGFVKVNYNVKALGVMGFRYNMSTKITNFDYDGFWLEDILLMPYVKYSKRLWKLIDSNYQPIDWQMDFKSGYRYSQKKFCKGQPIGKYKGVDVKVPWELSRLQHLPQMAVFSLVLPEYCERLIREFKNQVLDFYMTNPPYMGVNFTCTMDVAIRSANMLLAFDIFKQVDRWDILNDGFKDVFSKIIYEYGDFIIKNLEWRDDKNSNHYLSNISGLLFIAAYLEGAEGTDEWLVFSVQEIINEMHRQFLEDGGNFEGSTSYHRLSGEIMLYCTSLIYGILKTAKVEAFKRYKNKRVKRLLPIDRQMFIIENTKFFPEWYLNRLFKAVCFTLDITKESGNVPQVGDNDNGRFFKFTPLGEFILTLDAEKKYNNLRGYRLYGGCGYLYWDENILNHSTFISAACGLFDNEKLNGYSSMFPLEKSIVEAMAKEIKIKIDYSTDNIKPCNENPPLLMYNKRTEIEFNRYINGKIDKADIRLIPYADFGLYIFKSSEFYLCISAGQNRCHSHNDKLSFELSIGGEDIFLDPGTCLYTPFPMLRDRFRSTHMHNTVILGDEEQNAFTGVFSMRNQSKCYVLDYGKDYIKFYLTYRDIKIIREFRILLDRLIIKDSCNRDFYINLNQGSMYSNGYGKLMSLVNRFS